MSDSYDPWKLRSGLPLDGAEVEVQRAVFCRNNEINADATFLMLEFVTDAGDKYEQYYSTGNSEVGDPQGATLKSLGSKPGIGESSNYGQFIKGAMECGSEAMAFLRKGDPFRADTWVGSKWELGTVMVKRNDRTTGAKRESSVIVPVKFLGVSGGGNSSAKTSNTGVKGLTDEIDAELIELARNSDNHDEFVTEAFKLPSVSKSRSIQKYVMDQENGPWGKMDS